LLFNLHDQGVRTHVAQTVFIFRICASVWMLHVYAVMQSKAMQSSL